MLGLTSFSVIAAYTLCIASTIACVVYGIIYWNKGAGAAPTDSQKEITWQKDEAKQEEDL